MLQHNKNKKKRIKEHKKATRVLCTIIKDTLAEKVEKVVGLTLPFCEQHWFLLFFNGVPFHGGTHLFYCCL